jgi:hypothetical protein
MSTAASIARNLGAQRQGHNWRCACPLGCGYSLSIADGEDGTLLVHCFGGCEFDDIHTSLVEYGLFDDDDAELESKCRGVSPFVNGGRDQMRRTEGAIWVYEQARITEQVNVYLHTRGIALSSPVLRFSSNAPHRRLDIRLPAMVAPVVDIQGRQIGTHLTYLRADGSGKAELGHRELQRECHGEIRGGTIRLAPHNPDLDLIIGEGIETTISAMQIFDLPGWSAVSAGGLKTLDLPPEVRRILIAADHDGSGCSQRNAIEAMQRWKIEGRIVHIVMPKVVGADFNDVLVKREG